MRGDKQKAGGPGPNPNPTSERVAESSLLHAESSERTRSNWEVGRLEGREVRGKRWGGWWEVGGGTCGCAV